MAHRSCVSLRGHTAYQTLMAFVTLLTATEESVCVCVEGKHSQLLRCCADIKPIFQPEVSVKSALLCESWRRGAGSPAAADTTATS